MPTMIDARFDVLRTAGYTGAVDDMIFAWLLANGGTGSSTKDRWVSMLTAKGFDPVRTDGWYDLLKSIAPVTVGQTMSDLEYWFWVDNAGVLP